MSTFHKVVAFVALQRHATSFFGKTRLTLFQGENAQDGKGNP